VGRPLWREVGHVVFIFFFCWISPKQPFSVLSPTHIHICSANVVMATDRPVITVYPPQLTIQPTWVSLYSFARQRDCLQCRVIKHHVTLTGVTGRTDIYTPHKYLNSLVKFPHSQEWPMMIIMMLNSVALVRETTIYAYNKVQHTVPSSIPNIRKKMGHRNEAIFTRSHRKHQIKFPQQQ
jgi:hypothetical protein